MSIPFKTIAFFCIIGMLPVSINSMAAPDMKNSPCMREMIQANRTMSTWADNLEDMVNESTLPTTVAATLRQEADQVLDLIGDFGDNLSKKPVDRLVKDLVAIRKASNRFSLSVYLQTFDMRWPQTSVQISVTVERAEQACSAEVNSKAVLSFKR